MELACRCLRWHSRRLLLRKRFARSEEHTSELQSLMRISYVVFCLKNKNTMIQLHHRSRIDVRPVRCHVLNNDHIEPVSIVDHTKGEESIDRPALRSITLMLQLVDC